MLQKLIDTYEEVKKYVYIIERGNHEPIIIIFNNENFYHLVGLHKINLDIYFPNFMKSKDKRYKHMKKNIEKYDKIIANQIADKDKLMLRMQTFSNILDLLKGNGTALYNLQLRTDGSVYRGDYGLLKNYQDCYCLLGLKLDDLKEENIYVPQSWMASTRINKLVVNKNPRYFDRILAIPISVYNGVANTDGTLIGR